MILDGGDVEIGLESTIVDMTEEIPVILRPGYITKEMLISDEARGEHCKMYAKVTVPVGCEIGYHVHQGDEEGYYILSGTGVYNDNGTEMPAEPGDSFFCKEGDGHGIKNNGDEDITFMALILKK